MSAYRSASPPRCQQHACLGNTLDKTNSRCQIIPAFVTALSYYPTRWVHVQWGVLPSHLSSLKAALRLGNGKINKDSATNLCIHHCCNTENLICPTLLLLARRPEQVFKRGTVVYQKWVYLNINMCTKVQATIAYYFFFFLANKTLNTFLKEQMEISCDPFENEKKKKKESNGTAFND